MRHPQTQSRSKICNKGPATRLLTSFPRSAVEGGHRTSHRLGLSGVRRTTGTCSRQVWPKLEAPLAAAKMEEQITAAFEGNAQPYAAEFVPRLASDILTLMRDPDFPKSPKARVGFLADSLAGRPSIEPRTSRDICGKARARRRSKSPHRIIRKEFYVECSCGYKGPARDNACQRCGAQIPITLEELWGNPRLF